MGEKSTFAYAASIPAAASRGVACRMRVAELPPRQESPLPSLIPAGLLPPALVADLLAAVPDLTGQTRSDVYLEEIRLRADRYATLTVGGRNRQTRVVLTGKDLGALLTHLCGGSLYAYSDTIRQGFVTLPGGVRVGIAGRAVCEEGKIIGVYDIDGLCIRLPHRHGRVGDRVCRLLRQMASAGGSARGVLIYAPPGVGKTTLLRGVAAGMASPPDPWRTVVIDTRGELGFEGESATLCLDILRGYPRGRGVEIATRTLSAELIVCDEIGDVDEAMSLISAHHGGVPLVATAHAATVGELLLRPGIRLLHEAGLFGAYIGIRRAAGQEYDYRITPHAHAVEAAGDVP